MADRLDVSPTQGNLLRLQEELEQIRRGHDLLDRKQEILIQKLMEMITEAEGVEEEAQDRFRAAHEAMRKARMRMGTDRLRWISLASGVEISTKVRTRSIMGARVPVVQVDIKSQDLPYGLGDTTAALDEARERWLEVARLLGRLTEMTITVWRLAMELRKTHRRVNALESTMIPQYENTVSYIEQVLEEEDREDIVRAKKVKALRAE